MARRVQKNEMRDECKQVQVKSDSQSLRQRSVCRATSFIHSSINFTDIAEPHVLDTGQAASSSLSQDSVSHRQKIMVISKAVET